MLDVFIRYLDGSKKLVKIEQGDWVDLYSAETVELKAWEYRKISLGFAMQMPEGYEAHFVPRSSTFEKWGIIQVNSMAVIDNSYCGNNDIWKFPALAVRDTIINKGDKICQFRVVHKQPELNFIETDDLGNPNRGGFGSTGKQ